MRSERILSASRICSLGVETGRQWRSSRVLSTLLAVCSVAAACDRPAPALHVDDASPGADAVTWLGSFEVEETPQVINVVPNVVLDPRGGFLVVDVREAQLRRYDTDGRLLWHAGTKGAGPGEFVAPTAVARLRSGEIVAADRNGRLTVFNPAASAVVRTVQTKLGHVEDLAVVNDSSILISGILEGNRDGPRLHLWNLASDAFTNSFFAPFEGVRNKDAATVAGWSKVSVRGDTVAAIFAPSDTLYLFTVAGQHLGKIPIPFQNFRHGQPKMPRNVTDPRVRAEWLSSFDFVADVHWLPDGQILIPFQSVEPERGLGRKWHLLRMTRSGERTFEARNVAQLLAVNMRDGSLYFVDPAAEVPNRWALARLPQ